MGEIFAGAKDWLARVRELQPLDVLTIHPIGHLTLDTAVKAMGAQGYLKMRPGFRIIQHGTKIFIQREATPNDR